MNSDMDKYVFLCTIFLLFGHHIYLLFWEGYSSQGAQDSTSPSQSQDISASLQPFMFIIHSSSISLHKFPTLITWILTDNHFSLTLARNWKQGIGCEHKMGIDYEGKVFLHNVINARWFINPFFGQMTINFICKKQGKMLIENTTILFTCLFLWSIFPLSKRRWMDFTYSF